MVVFCVDGYDVKGRVVAVYAAANADAFALADGVMDDAFMGAEDAAIIDMDYVAGVFGFGADGGDDFCVVAVGDETDVLF